MSPHAQEHQRFGVGALHRPQSVDRSSLPTPLRYLTERKLLQAGPRAEWAAICCPSHAGASEGDPTMNVSLVDGHFRCRVCGAKGGDVVALHRLISGKRFTDAVRDLGGRFHG